MLREQRGEARGPELEGASEMNALLEAPELPGDPIRLPFFSSACPPEFVAPLSQRRFLRLQQIGAGMMSTVHLAVDTMTKSKVALKVKTFGAKTRRRWARGRATPVTPCRPNAASMCLRAPFDPRSTPLPLPLQMYLLSSLSPALLKSVKAEVAIQVSDVVMGRPSVAATPQPRMGVSRAAPLFYHPRAVSATPTSCRSGRPLRMASTSASCPSERAAAGGLWGRRERATDVYNRSRWPDAGLP